MPEPLRFYKQQIRLKKPFRDKKHICPVSVVNVFCAGGNSFSRREAAALCSKLNCIISQHAATFIQLSMWRRTRISPKYKKRKKGMIHNPKYSYYRQVYIYRYRYLIYFGYLPVLSVLKQKIIRKNIFSLFFVWEIYVFVFFYFLTQGFPFATFIFRIFFIIIFYSVVSTVKYQCFGSVPFQCGLYTYVVMKPKEHNNTTPAVHLRFSTHCFWSEVSRA